MNMEHSLFIDNSYLNNNNNQPYLNSNQLYLNNNQHYLNNNNQHYLNNNNQLYLNNQQPYLNNNNKQPYLVYPENIINETKNQKQSLSLCCILLWLIGLFNPLFALTHYAIYTYNGNQTEKNFAKTSFAIFILHILLCVLIIFLIYFNNEITF